jgi:hypothetical protein
MAGGLESPASKDPLGVFLAFDLGKPEAGWRKLPSWPGPGRFQAVAAAGPDTFYLFSGLRYETEGKSEPKLAYLRDAYRYSEKTGWEKLPDLPYPAVAAAAPAPVIAGEILLVGGVDGSGVGKRPQDFHQVPRRIQAYSIRDNLWSERGNAPVGRVCVSAVAWEERWILPSGERSPGVRSPEVWAIEPPPLSSAPAIAANSGPAILQVVIVMLPDPAGVTRGDERPAQVFLDFPALLKQVGIPGKADLATLRMLGLDPAGQARSGARFAYAREEMDLPVRWDDERVAGEFPSVEGVVDLKNGKLEKTFVRNSGLIQNAGPQEGGRGRAVWMHTARGEAKATYRLEVAVEPEDRTPQAPPRAWLGDGVVRFTTSPQNTTGSSHTRVDVADLNGDGRPDIVYGENYGRILVLLNTGSATSPRFGDGRFLLDSSGHALDAGISAAPLLVDWDGDGRKDLLVGTHWNRLLFFRNAGGHPVPGFDYRGVVEIEGRPLELPVEPVAGRPAGAFVRDYYPVVTVGDWDGDGRPDLLAGGYLTGRIYVFRNTGTGKDGTPLLQTIGPVMADGNVINVGDWAAAPSLADINADGRLDLITGSHPMTKESAAKKKPLRLYLNAGTPAAAELHEVPLPIDGEIPDGPLYSPRLADLNGDGLSDLVASAGAEIYWWPNTGTRLQPRFKVGPDAIRSSQGNTPLPVTQWIDWNHDGRVDAISNYTVRLNTGEGDPFSFGPPAAILADGQTIAHPSGIGDDWFHPRLFDFAGNGNYDVFFGDWHGQVWWHRRRGERNYDLDGTLLRLESGQPVQVGSPGQADTPFRALQGARTVFSVVDFTGDGRTDLVIGDTYGIVRLFRNSGSNEAPVFQEPEVLGDLGNRLSVEAIDWDDDGAMDVIAGSANGRVRVFLNQAKRPSAGQRPFSEGIDPGLPPVVQPRIIAGDLNGDGDVDLFLPGTQGSVWMERSFVRHGYAEGAVESVRVKP